MQSLVAINTVIAEDIPMSRHLTPSGATISVHRGALDGTIVIAHVLSGA